MSQPKDESVFTQFSSARRPELRMATPARQEQPPQEEELDELELEMEPFHPWNDGGKRPYQALVSYRSREQVQAIRFYCEDGKSIYQPHYSYLCESRTTSHKRLSIIYATHTMTLKGRNLWKLLGPLMQHRIIALIAFHEAYHLKPVNQDAPFIQSIIEEVPGK